MTDCTPTSNDMFIEIVAPMDAENSKCARPDSDTCGCTASVFKDIKKRIRKLRVEDE